MLWRLTLDLGLEVFNHFLAKYLNFSLFTKKYDKHCFMFIPDPGVINWNCELTKSKVIVPDSESRLGLMDYSDHGPCMTVNFCLWIRIVSKFNPMEGIFLKTSILNSSYLIFLIFPDLKSRCSNQVFLTNFLNLQKSTAWQHYS